MVAVTYLGQLLGSLIRDPVSQKIFPFVCTIENQVVHYLTVILTVVYKSNTSVFYVLFKPWCEALVTRAKAPASSSIVRVCDFFLD